MAKILIIDDEAAVRDTVRASLEREGHQIAEAGDGRAGQAAFEQNPADLAIIDIIMPNQEGIATIMALRRRNPKLKIIAISGGGRTRNVDFLAIAKQAGAEAILIKPFSREDLLRKVAGCLQS